MKIQNVIYPFLLVLFAIAITACSGGGGENSSASVNVKFVEQAVGKVVDAVPANVYRVDISAMPSNAANQTYSTSVVFSNMSTSQSASFQTLVDGETYNFEVWAYDNTNMPTYTGTASKLMQPGNNIVDVVCTAYSHP